MSYRRLSIIIPAYNEARTIERVLAAVKSVDLAPFKLEREIIVVDDGSVDATGQLVRKHADVRLIELRFNRGKGYAIRAALRHVTGDLVLIQDADLEYDPHDYRRLLPPILRGDTRVVFGSRFLHRFYPRRMELPNFAGNKLLTFTANLLYGTHLTDEATCYKLFDAELLLQLPLRCEEFEFCPEVIAHLARRHEPILEVPIEYLARLVGEGKKVRWTDAIHAMWTLMSIRFATVDARPPGDVEHLAEHRRASK